MEKLQQEGYDVDFIFFDDESNKNLKYYQTQADIVVEQLYNGWHGSTAVECMAVGKPVVTYIRPEVEAIIPHEHPPLINANENNIYGVLKNLVIKPGMRREIGEKSREYALRYHHYIVVAKQLESFYLSLFQ